MKNRRQIRKNLVIGCLLLLVVGTLTGGAMAKTVTIKLWTHGNPAYVAVAEALTKEFNETHPGIKVVHEYFPDFDPKVYSSFATRTEADIIEMYGSTLRFARGKSIAPVPEFVMTNEEIEATYWPATVVNRFHEGKYYGLPSELNLESPGLLVNMGLMAEAGVEIPAEWDDNLGPASWEELLAFARKLTVIEGRAMRRAGLGVIGGEEAAMLLSLIWQMGGDYRDPDNMKVHFDTPVAREAMQFIMDLIEGPDRVHCPYFSDRFAGFQENTIAMTIGAPWYAAVINQELPGLNYKYYNLPPFIPGSPPLFVGEGGWGLMVSSRSKHQEEAWEYVKWASQKEKQLVWAIRTGSIPARKDLMDDPYFVEGPGRDVFYPALQIAQYAVDPGAYTIDPYQFVWDIVLRNVSAITHKEVSVEEGLRDIENETNQMIAQMMKR